MKPLGLIAALLVAQAAAAQDRHSYGDQNPTTMRLVDVEGGADLIIRNNLTPYPLSTMRVALISAGGIEIVVKIETAQGSTPDRYMVIPPPGYTALPQVVDATEEWTTTVEIREALIG